MSLVSRETRREETRCFREFFARDVVRRRIVEFLGGKDLDHATCAYVASAGDGVSCARPPRELPAILEQGGAVSRSTWDRESLIVQLDLSHGSADGGSRSEDDIVRAYELLRPAVDAARELFLHYGLVPLHIVRPEGHRFLWRVRRESRAWTQLSRLGGISAALEELYLRPHAPSGEVIEASLGRAFAGLGRVVEYLAHRIIESSRSRSSIPLRVRTAHARGTTQEASGESVVLDISAYREPLFRRSVSVPFSLRRARPGAGIFLDVPHFGMDARKAAATLRDPERAAGLAQRASAVLPEQSRYMTRLIDDYVASGRLGLPQRRAPRKPAGKKPARRKERVLEGSGTPVAADLAAVATA